jgi:hypothetical protein
MGLGATLLQKAKAPRKVVSVPTPELGEDCPCVYVRVLSAAESDAYDVSCFHFDDETGQATRIRGNETARFCTFALCDPEGQRLFTLEDADDLGKLPRSVILRIYDAALTLNRMRKPDREAIKNVCSPTEDGASAGTASPLTTDAPGGS